MIFVQPANGGSYRYSTTGLQGRASHVTVWPLDSAGGVSRSRALGNSKCRKVPEVVKFATSAAKCCCASVCVNRNVWKDLKVKGRWQIKEQIRSEEILGEVN